SSASRESTTRRSAWPQTGQHTTTRYRTVGTSSSGAARHNTRVSAFRWGVRALSTGDGPAWADQARAIEALGFDTLVIADHVARFGEAVALIKRLFSEECVDHTGRFSQVCGAAVLPRPTQRPHPPIVVGGRGPRVLRIGGRLADIVSISQPPDPRPGDLSAEALTRSIELVRAAAGDRMSHVT